MEKAYDVLLKMILEKQLPVGEFLSQRKLSEITGTSVVSLREALKRLEGEGFLESIPRWGVRIPVETKEDLIYRYEIREALEVMAAYKNSFGIDEKNAVTLRRMAGECDAIDSADTDHILEFFEKHWKLHLFFAECTGNPLLVRELERLRIHSLIFQSAKTTWARDVKNWKTWHQDLMKDLLSGDPWKAQEAMRAHIRHGLSHDLKYFEEEMQGGEKQ
jgi:DNA-binding GntR family transcriptional regulator